MSQVVVLLTPPAVSHRTAEESIGIGYLASVLRLAGYRVEIIDAWLCGLVIEEVIFKIQAIRGVVAIGISAYLSSAADVADIILCLRGVGIQAPVIVGGFGPSFHPHAFFEAGCTYVVKGEAEEVIVPLVQTIIDGSKPSICGVSYLDNGSPVLAEFGYTPVRDIDDIPFPARDTITYVLNKKNPIHIATSRGCEASCLFCSIRSFTRLMPRTPQWRGRSINNIVDELQLLYEVYGCNCFKIVDDSFIENPRDERWAVQFANEILRRNMSIMFRTQIRADRITEDLTVALVDAGWFATSIGIENGSQTALSRMNKSALLLDNQRAIEILTTHRVYIQMGMILFDKDTSMQELWENFRFLHLLRWPVTKGVFTEMYAAEGTALTRKLIREGAARRSADGNYRYTILNDEVNRVYRALKQWHRSHAPVYDQTHNPISAPKVLTREGYARYHVLCMLLYRLDIDFFKLTLDAVSNGMQASDEDDFVCHEQKKTQDVFTSICNRVQALDMEYGLDYDAAENFFLND